RVLLSAGARGGFVLFPGSPLGGVTELVAGLLHLARGLLTAALRLQTLVTGDFPGSFLRLAGRALRSVLHLFGHHDRRPWFDGCPTVAAHRFDSPHRRRAFTHTNARTFVLRGAAGRVGCAPTT